MVLGKGLPYYFTLNIIKNTLRLDDFFFIESLLLAQVEI